MYINRDEFLLLSRRGSVPRSSGAGPPRPFGEPDPGHRRRRSPGVAADHGAGGRAWLRRVVAPARGATSPNAGARPAELPRMPARGYVDREAYLELEFAVGFGAEDELWL